MKRKILKIFCFALITASFRGYSKTCFYDPGSLKKSGDQFYQSKFKCSQWKVSKYWKDFGMEKSYWDDGMGYDDPCNVNKPLGRIMVSLEAIRIGKNSAFGPKNMLNFAYQYQKGAIKHLRVECGDPDTNAYHSGAGVLHYLQGYHGNGNVYFNWTGVYGGKSVVRRSGIILHESRHRAKFHNTTKCPSGGSCDSHWSYNGANTYQILWLWWFGRHGKNTTESMKNDALRDARWRHDNRFTTNPGKNI